MNLYSIKRRARRLFRPIPRAYGRDFAEQFAFLDSSQWWEPESLKAYQDEQLRRLILHCYENVPYYRRLFDERGLRPGDFNSVADLEKLPLLTKEIIRDNAAALTATNIAARTREFHTTGGTNGTPLGVWLEKRTNGLRMAFDWRFRGWAGFRFNDRHAFLRGRSVTKLRAGECCYFDPYQNCLLFSSFDMNESNMALYLKKISQFKPKFLLGYPSSLAHLAGFILDNQIEVNTSGELLGLITSSETVYPHQRSRITSAFKAPLFDYYGNTEQAARFGECAAHHGYHEFVEHGIIEIVEPDHDGVGEIVGTSFINYAMPLLRYRTGDRARRLTTFCPCGRGLPLLDRLEGRMHDFALLRDGTRLPAVALHSCLHGLGLDQLRQFQLVQEEVGHLDVLLIKGRGYQPGVCETMFKDMTANLHAPLEIHIRYVEEIPRTSEGKLRFFVQKMSLAGREQFACRNGH